MSSSRYGVYGHVLSWTEKAFREKEDAFQHEHLGDNLVGLMGSDIHLEGGSRLQEFSHPGEFPDSRQKAMVDFVQPGVYW
jgi:hypothetical protein